MLNTVKGDRVSYTVMYDTKPDTRYVTEYGRVTATWPADDPVMARIAVENIRPNRARYVTRKIRDLAAAPLPETAAVPGAEVFRLRDVDHGTYQVSGQPAAVQRQDTDGLDPGRPVRDASQAGGRQWPLS